MAQVILDRLHHRLALLVHLPPVFAEDLPPLGQRDDCAGERPESRDGPGDVEERHLRQRRRHDRADPTCGEHPRRHAQPARRVRKHPLHLPLKFRALRLLDQREIDPIQQLLALPREVGKQR